MTYSKTLKQGMQGVKKHLDRMFLQCFLIDSITIGLLLLCIKWFGAKTQQLALQLTAVDLNDVMQQSQTQAEATLSTLQGFAFGVMRNVALLIIASLLLWYGSRWIIWHVSQGHGKKHILSWAFFSYMGRSMSIGLLGLPFIAYPIIALMNLQSVGTIAQNQLALWSIVFLCMGLLYAHFQVMGSLLFFQKKRPYWNYLGTVISTGWKKVHYYMPMYAVLIVVLIVIVNLLNLITLTPVLMSGILFALGAILMGLGRTYARSVKVKL